MNNAALQSTQNTSNAVVWVVPTSAGGLKVVRWDTNWAKSLGGDPVPLFAAQPAEPVVWKPASELPPRWNHGPASVVVLAIAETGDGGFQMTPASVVAMSKGEWREARFDHNGTGRKLAVRCWTELPPWPKRIDAAAPSAPQGRDSEAPAK